MKALSKIFLIFSTIIVLMVSQLHAFRTQNDFDRQPACAEKAQYYPSSRHDFDGQTPEFLYFIDSNGVLWVVGVDPTGLTEIWMRKGTGMEDNEINRRIERVTTTIAVTTVVAGSYLLGPEVGVPVTAMFLAYGANEVKENRTAQWKSISGIDELPSGHLPMYLLSDMSGFTTATHVTAGKDWLTTLGPNKLSATDRFEALGHLGIGLFVGKATIRVGNTVGIFCG